MKRLKSKDETCGRKSTRLNITPRLQKLLDIKPEPTGGRKKISDSNICKRIVDERGFLPAVADALGVRFEALACAVKMDEDFCAAMKAAEALEIFEARRALRDAVLGGDIQAIKFFLEHRDPDFADAMKPPEKDDIQTLEEAMAVAEQSGYVVRQTIADEALRDPPKKGK